MLAHSSVHYRIILSDCWAAPEIPEISKHPESKLVKGVNILWDWVRGMLAVTFIEREKKCQQSMKL